MTTVEELLSPTHGGESCVCLVNSMAKITEESIWTFGLSFACQERVLLGTEPQKICCRDRLDIFENLTEKAGCII